MSETSEIAQARDEDPEALRDALLGQLAHLVDEVEALRTVVGCVPDQIKNGRPTPDALTMKELYGALATLDEEVRRPRIERVVREEEPALSTRDVDAEVREAGWNERAFDVILDRVKEARRQLVDDLETLSLDAWHRTATLEGETVTLFALAHRITRTDLERLRDLGYRLHGAHLSDRDKPLPT